MTRTYARRVEDSFRFFKGKAEGRIEAQVDADLTVLCARGLHVSDDALDRITGCRDLKQLDAWLQRAAAANSADELFD